MAIQYKPTKQKKEKTPKAPKAEKPIKIGAATQVKTTKSAKESKAHKSEKPFEIGVAAKVKLDKPAKASKQPKEPKPEKADTFVSAFKGGKVEKVAALEKSSVLKKKINPFVAVGIIVGLIAVSVLAVIVVHPAVKENGAEIKSILISEAPNKSTYFVGEGANYDGIDVVAVLKNGETLSIPLDQCQISGFDSSEVGYNTVTVNYQGFTARFIVEIQETPRITPTLKKITLETLPDKIEYKLGEWLDTTGGVILCEYVDGSVFRVSLSNRYVYGFPSIEAPGEYVLTVKYMENGTLAETTYTITVTE